MGDDLIRIYYYWFKGVNLIGLNIVEELFWANDEFLIGVEVTGLFERCFYCDYESPWEFVVSLLEWIDYYFF